MHPPLARRCSAAAGGEGGGDGAARRRAEGTLRLRQALDLAAAGAWSESAAALAAGRSQGPDLPRFPVLEAAVCLLAGRRRDAIAGLVLAQRRDPHDPGIARLLLLACYHALRQPGDHRLPPGPDGPASEESASLLELAVASWVALLHQDRFWTAWLVDRLRRYGEDRPELSAMALRQEVTATIAARIEAVAAGSDHGGELAALYQRELAAAEALAGTGGFPFAGRQDEPLVCGPLRLQALGCEQAFGAFLASLPVGGRAAAIRVRDRPGRAPDAGIAPASRQRCLEPEALERLRRSFSRLGLAEALLDLDRPAEAWAALGRLACLECRTAAGAGSPTVPAVGWPVVACAETCPRFDRENPGYAGWREKARRLERDASELAARVQVALGCAGMTAPGGGPEAAATHFRAALRLAAALDRQPQATEGQVVDAVLGRVKALAGKGDADAAIALLEATLAVCEETAAAPPPLPPDAAPEAAPLQELAGRLAELLVQRGLASRDSRRWEAAAADLRRAVAWNPHAAGAVLGLASTLGAWARRMRPTAPARAIELALEAVQQLAARLPDLAGRPELQESLDGARQAARELVLGRAAELTAAHGYEQALQAVEQALAVLGADTALASRQREIVLRYARHLEESGQPVRALEVLRRATRQRAGAAAEVRPR
jgi:tetratricopeptide (TPR) repeat protein